LLSRLQGMETELAILVTEPSVDGPSGSTSGTVSNHSLAITRAEVFEAIRSAIAQRVPMAASLRGDQQWFLGNGGAISFDSQPVRGETLQRGSGLFEFATPECAGPTQCMAYQRAMERLVVEACGDPSMPVKVRVVKHSTDADGHVYGSQENYQTPIARGLRLLLWRFCLIVLLGLHALFVAVSSLGFAVVWSLRWCIRTLIGRRSTNPWRAPTNAIDSASQSRIAHWLLRALHAPVAIGFMTAAYFLAFVEQRRSMTAFLVSRTIWSGAGFVDDAKRFGVSIKGLATNQVVGLGQYIGGRPIYSMGYWLRTAFDDVLFQPKLLKRLLAPLQRLQIGCSDASMSDEVEYLRLATATLVLDAIEAGYGRDLPRLSRPIDALHTWSRDWVAVARVKTSRGGMTALEVQWKYHKMCEQFVHEHADRPRASEGRHVLAVWRQRLEQLRTATRHPEESTEPLLGRIDWITKRWLIEQAGSDASTATRQAIDVQYHALSDQGYFRQLQVAATRLAIAPAMPLDEHAVATAARLGPADTSGGQRGGWIREFTGSGHAVQANWWGVVVASSHPPQRRTLMTHQ
jgi:Pup amidohydrolase